MSARYSDMLVHKYMDLLWIERPRDIRHDMHPETTMVAEDEWQMEVVLVHGFHPQGQGSDAAMDYWGRVWEWVQERWPECCEQEDFPSDWASDPGHERDMEILTCIHRWQQEWRRKLET